MNGSFELGVGPDGVGGERDLVLRAHVLSCDGDRLECFGGVGLAVNALGSPRVFNGQGRRGPTTPNVCGFSGGGCDNNILANFRVGRSIEFDVVDSKLCYYGVVGVDRSCWVADVVAIP